MTTKFWIGVGIILSCLAIAGLWFLYRLYKHAGKRCDCGEMWANRRICKIHMAPGDFHPMIVPETLRDIYRAQGWPTRWEIIRKFRWWYRNVETVVFADCSSCKGQPGSRKVVTISTRPISIWHLFWVWWFDREQFHDDPALDFIFDDYVRKKWLKKPLENGKDENPDFKVTL